MGYNKYYQYDTNPRKLKPEYEPVKREYPKKSTAKGFQGEKKQLGLRSYIEK